MDEIAHLASTKNHYWLRQWRENLEILIKTHQGVSWLTVIKPRRPIRSNHSSEAKRWSCSARAHKRQMSVQRQRRLFHPPRSNNARLHTYNIAGGFATSINHAAFVCIASCAYNMKSRDGEGSLWSGTGNLTKHFFQFWKHTGPRFFYQDPLCQICR